LRLVNGGNNSVYTSRGKSHSNQNNNRQSGVNQIAGSKNQKRVCPNPSSEDIPVFNSQKVSILKVTNVIGNVV
jgi:hypothetical protein